MSKLISVIIPVCNVSAYLPDCIRSVLHQDHQELEVILIDDGSTDDSDAICDEWAARDSRIQVIHQKNGGAAAAKNAGLRAATGAYLSFVDSDDYLEPGAYSHMLELMRQYDADVVQCTYRDVYRDHKEDQIHREGRTVFGTTEYLRRYTTDWTCGLLWDKLYRRTLFDDISFEEGHKIDDEYFTYRGIMNANKVVCDDHIIYNYRKRRSSVMASPESGRKILLDRIDYLGKRRINIANRFPELREVFDRHFLESMLFLSTDPLYTAEARSAVRSALADYLQEKGHTPIPAGWLLPLARLWLHRPRPTARGHAAAADDFFD